LFGNYFNTLEDDIYMPKAHIALAWVRSGKWHHEYFADTFLAACRADWLREERINSFFSVAPRNRESRKEYAIPHLLTLHLDVDHYNNSVEQKIKREQPSALVWSGNGLHAYWFLDAPVPIRQKLLIRSLNRELVRQFDGDLKATDVGHVLRVPGTFNVKNAADPKLVKLIECDANRRYPLDELVDRFGAELNNLRPESVKRSGNDSTHSKKFLGPGERAYVDRLLSEGLYERSSRNDATLLLARHCLEQEMTSDEAKRFLVGFFDNNHNGLSKDWLGDRKGCIRQIASAVDSAWKKAPQWEQSYYGRPVTDTRKLSVADLEYVSSLGLTECDRLFVIDALRFILNNQRDGVIVLETRKIKEFHKVHPRNYKEKLALLEQLEIIKLLEKGKSQADPKKRKASTYKVLYQFQYSIEAAEIEQATIADRIDALILSGHENDEIRKRVSEATRQQICYRRSRFNRLMDTERYDEVLLEAA
jgi:hypothetical protein